jgi:glucose 1-dehydrogenase
MIDLKGKIVLVLGQSDALSDGVATCLAQAGAEIVGGKTLNLSDPEVLRQQIAALGPVNIVVINPGWFDYKQFMYTSSAEWAEAFAQNYEQAIYMAQAAAKYLIQEGNGGRIIILSSVSAIKPMAFMSAVGTSLAALHGLARMAAVDLGVHKITVNVVAAGWTEQEAEASVPDTTTVEAGIPAGRTGTVEDVGDVCCFLASEMADYITGQIIPVDGGYLLTKANGEAPKPLLR